MHFTTVEDDCFFFLRDLVEYLGLEKCLENYSVCVKQKTVYSFRITDLHDLLCFLLNHFANNSNLHLHNGFILLSLRFKNLVDLQCLFYLRWWIQLYIYISVKSIHSYCMVNWILGSQECCLVSGYYITQFIFFLLIYIYL